MKILLIGSIPQNLVSIKGGVESATINLLKGLSNLDVKVMVLSFRKDIKEKTVLQFDKNISIVYFPFRVIRSTKFFLLIAGNYIIHKIIKEFVPDIIHIEGAGTSLLLTLLIDKDKLIVTPHGILSEELKYKNELKQKVNHLLTLQIEKHFITRIRNFIFISGYSKEMISRYHQLKVKSLNSIVIPNPLDHAFLAGSIEFKDSRRILYVGTIRRLKGLIILIETVNSLHLRGIDFQLDIAGGFEEEDYKTEILQYIQKNELSGLLNFHGWIDQERLRELMSKDLLFVLPSFLETFSISSMEAMASGMVVIASNVGGVKELIKDGVTGFLFEPGDKERLGKLLSDIINNKIDTMQIRTEARKTAFERYNPELIAEATLSFYKKVGRHTQKK